MRERFDFVTDRVKFVEGLKEIRHGIDTIISLLKDDAKPKKTNRLLMLMNFSEE